MGISRKNSIFVDSKKFKTINIKRTAYEKETIL